MDGSVISLWTKVPETGDRIVICSSLKDSLVLSCQLGIPAIAPQGEGYNISESACKELRRRYKKVFICFDTDEAGKKDAEALAEKTGFINVVPDLGKQKDLSDYYKSLKDKEDFKKLESYFH
jgi:DNA primase